MPWLSLTRPDTKNRSKRLKLMAISSTARESSASLLPKRSKKEQLKSINDSLLRMTCQYSNTSLSQP
jgi:hypothetical protein